MSAYVIHVQNPIAPTLGRRVEEVVFPTPITSLAPDITQPFICILNGQPLLRADWCCEIRDGDVAVFIALPGRGGGSNPVAIVAMLAVTVLSMGYGSVLASTMGLNVGATVFGELTVGALFKGALVMAGGALVSALIPPPRAPSPLIAQELASPSPTYSLAAQGNMARIEQPIPVIYGRHVVFMDYAAQPYAEYAGNEQFLYLLLVVGQGHYDIEQLRLADTIMERDVIQDGAWHEASGVFEEVTYQVVAPGGVVSLYPQNVTNAQEVSGQEIAQTDLSLSYTGSMTFAYTGSTIEAATGTPFVNSRAGDHFTVTGTANNDGTFKIVSKKTSKKVTIAEVLINETAASTTLAPCYLGPFVINGSGTEANAITFDLVAPRGLYYANSNGGLNPLSVTVQIEVQPLDDNGEPAGDWVVLSTPIITSGAGGTTTPQRESLRYSVTPGRYRARMSRVDQKNTTARAGHDIVWGGARAYLPGSQAYGDITLLAIRVRATNQLSSASSRLMNAIVTRRLPRWSANGWTEPQATRSIAWALADVCRAGYGLRFLDSRIDLQGLAELDALWEERQDRCDMIVDASMTAWEALGLIAKAGRASPVMQGGVVRFVRDSEPRFPVAMFTGRNIVKRSLNIEYLLPTDTTSDAIDVSYFDGQIWQWKTVRAALPGSTQSNVTKVKLAGVTSRPQAWREGMYFCASNRYRRTAVRFTTEMEGFILTLGDLIAIQHDMPSWGQGGDVVAFAGNWEGEQWIVTCSQDLDWSGEGPFSIAFRRRDGSVDGPFLATQVPDTNNQVMLDGPPGAYMEDGTERERTSYAFGRSGAIFLQAKVTKITPRDRLHVEVAAIIDSPYVYSADADQPPVATSWPLTARNTAPAVAGLAAGYDQSDQNMISLSWRPAAGANSYVVEISDSGGRWTRVADTHATQYVVRSPYGSRTLVRVAAVGVVRGPWVEIAYGASASYMWNDNPNTLMWAENDSAPMWGVIDNRIDYGRI